MDDVLAGLSRALDLVEGQPLGHAGRSTLIALRFADRLGLDPGTRVTLRYAALLKDAGCSSNAARIASLFGNDDREVKAHRARLPRGRRFAYTRYVLRHTRPHDPALSRARGVLRVLRHSRADARPASDQRCRDGARVIADLGLPHAVPDALRALDERWDGTGLPDGIAGDQIPLAARIVHVAQTAEVWASVSGVNGARRELAARAGSLLDPNLVDAFSAVLADRSLWTALAGTSWMANLHATQDEGRVLLLDGEGIERVARVFARIVDRKSPYTATHSQRVGALSDELAPRLRVAAAERRPLRCAALLHDIGKLGVPNTILDAPRPLTASEWAQMRVHPAWTYRILRDVGAFRALALGAAAHHERLDGSGYPNRLHDRDLGRDARILGVADTFEALTALRPYRDPMPAAAALATIRAEAPGRYDHEVVDALTGLVADEAPVTRPTPAAVG